MAFWRTRSMRNGAALALLVSVGVLLGLSTVAHSHDGDVPPRHCEACRWASAVAPALVVVLLLLLTLPESGPTHVPAPAVRARAPRRRIRSRGPPLV